jgi:hypothetical protein
MTVGQLSSTLSGGSGATKAVAAAAVEGPPSPLSPLPESQVCRGSRFWALAGESSNKEEEEEEEEVQAPASQVEELSPRSGPSHVTLGDFVSPAWSQVSSRASAVSRKGRSRKFAPGEGGSVALRRPAGAPCLILDLVPRSGNLVLSWRWPAPHWDAGRMGVPEAVLHRCRCRRPRLRQRFHGPRRRVASGTLGCNLRLLVGSHSQWLLRWAQPHGGKILRWASDSLCCWTKLFLGRLPLSQ